MAFLKKWKNNWELKSLNQDELFQVVIEVILKQLDEVEKDEISLDANIIRDFEADSVDIVAMLLYLEDMFKEVSANVPTDKLGQIVLVEDIFDTIYEVLLEIENKMETFSPIKPDYDIIEKRPKMGG